MSSDDRDDLVSEAADAGVSAARLMGLKREAWAMATTGAGLPSAVLAFTASMLTAARSARPATAHAFADALHAAIVAKK